MKKLITLFAFIAFIGGVQAQTASEEARRVILGGGSSGDRKVEDNSGTRTPDNRYPETYPNSGTRDAQINQVNREYDAKIHSIRNNPYLSASEKDRMIDQLNRDRAKRIREINKSYDSSNKDYRKNNKHNKNKNHGASQGKKKGWDKNGKRSGDDDDDD